MSEDSRHTLIGALALVVLGALAFVIFGGKSISAASKGYVIQASFGKIDGLNIGDDVRLSGIKIGEVSRMRLGPDFAAIVDLRIDSPVGLPTDTSAAIHTDGLFGSKHVVLVPGADDHDLKSGGRIDLTQDSVVVTDLLDLIIGEAKANAAKRDAKANGAPSAPAKTPAQNGDATETAPAENPAAPGGLLAPLLGDQPPANKKGDE
jgi:phospholipid/cholesterol/gamma-HCH transport system substrate-binding protein